MANPQYTGSFVPITQEYDISEIYTTDVTSEAFKELIVRLYEHVNRIGYALNTKDTGIYPLQEFINSQVWFPNLGYSSATPQTATYRQVYRKVVNFGPLPNAGAHPIPHGIVLDASTRVTRIYGAATDPAALRLIPLPFATPTALNENIELAVVGATVVVTTGINRTNFTDCYIVIEYIRG
jgi:hypothetical protein